MIPISGTPHQPSAGGDALRAWCWTEPSTPSRGRRSPATTVSTGRRRHRQRAAGQPGRLQEFYLLNYFKPATSVSSDRSADVNSGRTIFTNVGCTSCHVASLTINADRRVADVDTVFSTSTRGAHHQRQSAQPAVRDRDDPLRHHRRSDGCGAGPQAAGPAVVRRQQLLRGSEAPRSGHQLHGAQLRRDVPAAVHDRAAVGRGDHCALRARRPYADAGRGHHAPRRRGAGRARQLQRPVARQQEPGAGVPEQPGAVPARRHGVEPAATSTRPPRTSRRTATARSR